MKYELEGSEMKKYGGSWRDSDGVILKEEHYALELINVAWLQS